MDKQSSRPPHARRSEIVEGRRSASAAPAAVHLVLATLVALLIFISYQAGRQLARPLTDKLAASWQEEPLTSAIQQEQTTAPDGMAAFTPEVQRWQQHIIDWADQSGLPPTLIATVIQIESCGDPLAQSGAGALGLFQVMPYHFDENDDPLLVETNARAGLSYLRRSYELADGIIERALAGYNGGHGVIQRASTDWPAETQRYVSWGAGILADIQAGQSSSPTLAAWLEAGGASLCRQAAQRQLAAY